MRKLPVYIAAICYLFLSVPAHASQDPVELLVIYRAGQSPHELQQLVDERSKNARESKWEEAKQTIESIQLRFAKKMTPEKKLARLLQIEKQLGVVIKKPVSIDEDGSQDVYWVQVVSPYLTEHVIALYAQLNEVEYIEVHN